MRFATPTHAGELPMVFAPEWDSFEDFECDEMGCVKHHERHVWTPDCRDFMNEAPIQPKTPKKR